MAEDVKGMMEWALPLSHTCAGQGQQQQEKLENQQPKQHERERGFSLERTSS